MNMRTNFVAAVCLACWLIIAGSPVSGYNSLNESAEAALLLNIPALERDQVNLSQENWLNLSDIDDEMPQNLTSMGPSMSDSVNNSNTNTNYPSHLSIVDYWGNHYLCDAKCVFLHDASRMIVVPCKTGLLKLYEVYPRGEMVESGYIRVYAHRRYNWWFVGDTVGLHTMSFTVRDRYGLSLSNEVEYEVISENCPGIANCSPSSNA